MNDTSTHSDPFAQIQNTEGSAEKDIERKAHKNAEALAEAKLAKETELKEYEEGLKAEGMGQLREIKAKATEKANSELKAAMSEAEALKNNASKQTDEAVKIILETFETEFAS
ncbi:hypothetical protein HOG48_06545 [Candidatus Peregrinibacteria bacterium]|jgi:hypothetical protein|nr:hypothetical protein [Candidatus Peregrinibacteria bacterium]